MGNWNTAASMDGFVSIPDRGGGMLEVSREETASGYAMRTDPQAEAPVDMESTWQLPVVQRTAIMAVPFGCDHEHRRCGLRLCSGWQAEDLVRVDGISLG